MGLLRTRWEGAYRGHRITIIRSEFSRGFWVEWDGAVIARKPASLVGIGSVSAAVDINGHNVPVTVELTIGSACTLLVGGEVVDCPRASSRVPLRPAE